MAEPSASTTENQPDTAPTAPAAAKSVSGKLLVAAFVGGVVLTECLAAYLFLPSPSRTEALAGAAQKVESEAKETEQRQKDKEKLAAEEQTEIDLGEFKVTAFQPASNTTLRISFHLFGTVSAAEKAEFEARKKENEHRFREQVIVTLRSAEMTDLTDPGLGLLKRTILEKTNALMGKALLKAVVFSDFSFVEG
jgi:flagellar FliL protein